MDGQLVPGRKIAIQGEVDRAVPGDRPARLAHILVAKPCSGLDKRCLLAAAGAPPGITWVGIGISQCQAMKWFIASVTIYGYHCTLMTDQMAAMQIEMSTEYYIGHLRKINRSLASRWSLLGAHHRHLNEFIRAGVRLGPDGGRVLDAGCGLSIWVTPEMRKKYSITGVDIQPDSIRACQQIYPGCEYQHADLYNMPFPDGAFDVVVMREVIEHFKRPADAVREVVRLLKPGGHFVLTTPNYDSWLLFFIEHTYNRFFGGPCKPYLDDVHPSRFHFSTIAAFFPSPLDVVTCSTIDFGISLACVCRRR